MAKAGAALKQVLEAYGISQNKLATIMRISHSNVHRWINGAADPLGDSILEIRNALEKIEMGAGEAFIRFYLETLPEERTE
ncbi:MAG: helix-turn-helix transcriptional regulator [Oscillatoriophycideae cyanobacterium NC_groundwater_1537_Pr4_S-0.65um_50_18]|nr:helix-turn-helix transcriptional regulator [Oscillatoriophycideae cyanobacterium NC_groundwater_1537_Pr4_S-0.65um_50_18]